MGKASRAEEMSDFVPYNDPDVFESLHRFQADRLAKRVTEDSAFLRYLKSAPRKPKPIITRIREAIGGFLRRLATRIDGYDPEDE